MTDSIMYQDDAYVVLETHQPEQFLSPNELLDKLKTVLANYTDKLPPDLQALPTLDAQAQHLRDTYCEFDLGPDQYLQWYVVRLEK